MSRTRNTAPLDVQARWLPAWTSYEWHTPACDRGTSTCGLDLPRDPTNRYSTCWRSVHYYGGIAGGSRSNQSLCADIVEGASRAALRSQLRAAVKTVNAALRDNDVDAIDSLDIHAIPESTAWMMY